MLQKNRHFAAYEHEHILLDKRGKPVLDKDGNPVYMEISLGSRPTGLHRQDEEFGELPPDDRDWDNSELKILPLSQDSLQDPEKQTRISLTDDKAERSGDKETVDPLASLLDEEMNKQDARERRLPRMTADGETRPQPCGLLNRKEMIYENRMR